MKRVFIIFILFFVLFVEVNAESVALTDIECVDGDTIRANINGEKKTVRFIAIDTPETKYSTKSNDEPFAVEASEWTCKRLNEASNVQLEYDPKSEKSDKYGRELGWIFLDGVLLQKELVQNGYAKVKYVYDDYKYVDELKLEEEKAKSNKIGIWSNNIEEDDNNNEIKNDDDSLIDRIIDYIIDKIKELVSELWKKTKELFKNLLNL